MDVRMIARHGSCWAAVLTVLWVLGACSTKTPAGDAAAAGDDGKRDRGTRLDGVAPDSAASGDSGLPFGWISPRCDNAIVPTCAACPGKPLLCNACTLSAVCVADCASGCNGLSTCQAAGTCIEKGQPCTPQTLCGCPAQTKLCQTATRTSCESSCGDCPGKAADFVGRCDDFPEKLGGCPDGSGPEYFCQYLYSDNTGRCADSCASCGPGYCISASCSDRRCASGYLPGKPYYNCGKRDCCATGFWCPQSNSCVASCAACAGYTAGACGAHGACVAKCSNCFSNPGAAIAVCDGVCVDTNTDYTHCGKCGNACPASGAAIGCAAGHCCAAARRPFVWEWCEACNCCVGQSGVCHLSNCATTCLQP